MYKILFMGTPQIAADVLEEIINIPEQYKVIGVVCQPDRALDRKKQPIFCPVKQVAIKYQISIYQPEKINSVAEELNALDADLIVTCAYGQFIGSKILEHAKYGGVNFHASLLPKWRGGAPIHRSIINGDSETGVSLMRLVSQMDAGDFLVQKTCQISGDETATTLFSKLDKIACAMVREDLQRVFEADAVWTKQDEAMATFAPTIKKEETLIDWNQPSKQIDHLIRGLAEKPLAIWMYNGDTPIKIWSASITNRGSVQSGGAIVSITKAGIEITTADLNMLITKLQLPNKRPMLVSELINGQHIFKISK